MIYVDVVAINVSPTLIALIDDLYLQTGWSIPVELIIGPDVGISYMAIQGSQVSLNWLKLIEINIT